MDYFSLTHRHTKLVIYYYKLFQWHVHFINKSDYRFHYDLNYKPSINQSDYCFIELVNLFNDLELLKRVDNIEFHLKKRIELYKSMHSEKLFSFHEPGELTSFNTDYTSSFSLYERYSYCEEYLKYLVQPELQIIKSGEKNKELVNLEHRQIALLYIYKNQSITKNNSKSIAEKHGQTSGQKLKESYDLLIDRKNRVYCNGTKRGNNKMEENIKKIIPFLSEDEEKNAQLDLADLKKNRKI